MNFLRYLFGKIDPLEPMSKELEQLYEKYNEAVQFYCAKCKRGFERTQYKKAHDRRRHPEGENNI